MCKPRAVEYCSHTKNTDNAYCRSFCKLDKNKADCDVLMGKFCKKKKQRDSDLCSCINSPLIEKYKKAGIVVGSALCMDTKCSSKSGYITTSMAKVAAGGCPAICQQIVTAVNQGVIKNVDTSNWKLVCGASGIPLPKAPDKPTSDDTPTPDDKPTSDDTPTSTPDDKPTPDEKPSTVKKKATKATKGTLGGIPILYIGIGASLLLFIFIAFAIFM